MSERQKMLDAIGVKSVDELLDKTIPDNIRLKKELDLPEAMNEYEYLHHIKELSSKNKVYNSYIGLGYYNTIVPPVVLRNIFENPGWYTSYTPYQAEISQGRLEALLNFQTVIVDMTGLPMANASLLDEGTAAAEAMIMLYNARPRKVAKAGVNKFFVDKNIFPQTLAIVETHAGPKNINLVFGDYKTAKLDDTFFGAMVQFPAADGSVNDYRSFIESANESGVKVAVAADLMSLALLSPPGEWGAEVVFGNSQRFGVPMGNGGPHAGYFATKEDYKRFIPGRIIGITHDKYNNPAYRMALQTREQHIKRERATSNICTAQALLAIMAGMYAVYHGPDAIKEIAERIHVSAVKLENALLKLGLENQNKYFFDTLKIKFSDTKRDKLKLIAEKNHINFNYYYDGYVGISIDETTSDTDLENILAVFVETLNKDCPNIKDAKSKLPKELVRTSEYLTHEVFNKYRSETAMMRYIKHLENKDFSLVHGMIPLGSCTMKLNAASELLPISSPEWTDIHPFAPEEQTRGYREMIKDLEKYLSVITGFDAVSLQPNSGAQGEFAGLMVIRAYHHDRGDDHRNVVLIPSSAHGTNPASAVMAGMKVIIVECDDKGNIRVDDLKAKAELHKENLSAFMVTYPSTHGVFEKAIMEMTQIIHDNGGMVYMDGANMNAQVGLTNPGAINADVCHLNLHKTFAIPHGGGGPGVGPIGVNKKLSPYLPGNPVVKTGGKKAITAISSAPWGSVLVSLISYGYIRMLGTEGLKQVTIQAIINANYLRAKLQDHYSILYTGEKGMVAHEMIVDFRGFKQTAHIEVGDVAKRLADYSFHAPTVSFPVGGTLMVEPTESEPLEELDRFVQAMIAIRNEIKEIEDSKANAEDNVLHNAPHTAQHVLDDNWEHEYSRAKAVYPLYYLRGNKYWPTVSRVDDAFGDRNLVCTCAPIDDYRED
jgi:glycine dehydrogenase